MTQLAGASVAAKTVGAVAQYQVDATSGTAENPGSGITGYDSGNIVTQNRPGKGTQKLVDGTIQQATAVTVDATAGNVGNALLANQNGQNYTTDPFTGSAGLSLAGNRE
jgi:hypothetical protein